jgi:catechol 2,3-dioxygenase-like lactoylglutathione lyase family enzyme
VIPHVTLVVRDYDEAIRFYVDAVGFELREDTDLGAGKRWVVVAPADGATGLLLAKATTPAQEAAVGNQTGGRVGFFLEVADFAEAHARMTAAGVTFLEAPRVEPYATVAVWQDLYGNRWTCCNRPSAPVALL